MKILSGFQAESDAANRMPTSALWYKGGAPQVFQKWQDTGTALCSALKVLQIDQKLKTNMLKALGITKTYVKGLLLQCDSDHIVDQNRGKFHEVWIS